MFDRLKILGYLLVLLLSIAGCVTQLPVPSQDVPPTPTAALDDAVDGEEAAQPECPAPTADQELARNEAAGYCFLIPAGYETSVYAETGGLVVLAPTTTEGHRERLIVEQEQALGRSLEEVTQQVLADFTIPSIPVDGPSTVTLAGEPATVIGKMPGQDLNRRVLSIHNDRVYRMIFMPDDGTGQAYEEMEALYDTVMNSIAFVPPTTLVGLPLVDDGKSGYPTDFALSWEGRTYGDDGTIAECHRLTIAADGHTWAGNCENVALEVADAPYQWNEVLNHFAPFVSRGGDSDMVFAGQGETYHPAWARALDAWARVSYEETASGRVGATSRTALSWWLGEAEDQAGMCKHLIVLSHGYAYANVDPCDGGESHTVAEGWLETATMDAFGNWLQAATPTYVEDNYLDGRGKEPLSQAAIDEIAQWADHVYQRLIEQAQ